VKDVDCVAQKFFADFTLFMKWYDPAHEGITAKTVSHHQDSVTIPDVMIANAIQLDVRDEMVRRFDEDPPGVLMVEVVYTGVLTEYMELELFPCDIQDLTISVRFKDLRWSAQILEETIHRRICSSVEMSEWKVFQPVHRIHRDLGHQFFDLKVKILRKPEFYKWNIMFMVGGITTLTFFTFLFEVQEWEQRSTYSATLLLTSVAFKFSIGNSLPKVSFFTVLDVYLFVSFVFMLLLILESAVLKGLTLSDWGYSFADLRALDLRLCAIYLALWVLCNLWFLFRFDKLEQRQTSKLGHLLTHISTNKVSKGAMGFLIRGDLGDSDDDSDAEDAGVDSSYIADRGSGNNSD
jgi:hypothetical protein